MDWVKILTELLTPIVIVVAGGATTWAMNWLRKKWQAQTGVIVSDDQFDAAKKSVLNAQKQMIDGFITREQRKPLAILSLQQARPAVNTIDATRKVEEAVAVVKGIEATAIPCSQPNLVTGSGGM